MSDGLKNTLVHNVVLLWGSLKRALSRKSTLLMLTEDLNLIGGSWVLNISRNTAKASLLYGHIIKITSKYRYYVCGFSGHLSKASFSNFAM